MLVDLFLVRFFNLSVCSVWWTKHVRFLLHIINKYRILSYGRCAPSSVCTTLGTNLSRIIELSVHTKVEVNCATPSRVTLYSANQRSYKC